MAVDILQALTSGGLSLDSGTPLAPGLDYNSGPYPTYYPGGGTGVLGASTTNQTQTDPYAQYGGAAAYNNTLGGYDQAIGNTNAAIGRLGSQQASGNQGIDSSYTNAINQLLGSKNIGERNYNDTKLTNGQNYVASKNTIGAQAGSSLNSLLRLLGSRGVSGSPIDAARQAVTRNAGLQRTDVGNTFGQNQRAADTNWNDFLNNYNNQVSGAGSQRDQQKSQLQSQIDSNRASLLQTLAQLNGQKAGYTGGNVAAASQSYLDQANQLLDKTANYTTAPINYQTQAYNAPSLASYTVGPNAAAVAKNAGQTNDYTSPYLAALLGKKQTAGV